ncbi:MAG TPA: heme-copper oxidase subunit III, partial [Puia sp.]|nr:heme-copper oxidase subunit III [Puia sp.]
MTKSENATMIQAVIFTEAFFFLCLIMSFIYMAYNSGFQPSELSRLDIRSAGVYTVVLIASSFTLHFAERGYTRGRPAVLKGWLIVTIVLGAIFLAGQGTEYGRLIG